MIFLLSYNVVLLFSKVRFTSPSRRVNQSAAWHVLPRTGLLSVGTTVCADDTQNSPKNSAKLL